MFPSLDSIIQVTGRHANVSGRLVSLIMTAYELKDNQILDAPRWNSAMGQPQYYDVIFALQDGDISPQNQIKAMLKTVLAERFQLRYRLETKDLPAYDLVVADSGTKFTPDAPGDACSGPTPGLPCPRGLFGIGPLGVTHYSFLTIPDLVGIIASWLHIEVRDKTGVSAHVNYTEKIFIKTPDDVSGALNEQLGLRLIPATQLTDTLVIDHAEKPSLD